MDKAKIILNIVKENVLYVFLVLVVIFLFVSYVIPQCTKAIDNVKKLGTVKTQYEDVKQQYDALKLKQQQQNSQKKVVKDGKVVFDAPDMQFSPDASFAPLFELILTLAQQSGIRIRSIDYNYAPADDMIYSAKISGYNTCQLDMVMVGSYSEIQNFFKSVLKEQYLTNLGEVELMPWEKDKKILGNSNGINAKQTSYLEFIKK